MPATPLSRPNSLLRSALGTLLLSGGLLLGSCESRPIPWLAPPASTESQPPLAADTAAAAPSDTVAVEAPPAPVLPVEPPAPPVKLQVEPGKPPYRMLPGLTTQYRRYVGQLGARQVVMELFVGREYKEQPLPRLFGRYYATRTGAEHEFAAVDFYPRRPLRLKAYAENDSAEHWQLRQPLGPWLTGTVTTAGQPLRRVTLREDYRQAVPLAIRSASMYGRPTVAEFGDRGEPGQFTGSYRRQYVQVLGKAAQRPALRQAFPSRPAQVRARLRQEFEQGEAHMADIQEYMSLTINDNSILGYSKYISDFGAGSAHPQNIFHSWSYDLHTGRRLTLATLLKPGSTKALLRLALHYMDAEYKKDIQEWWDNPQAPAEYLEYVELEECFGLTPAGMLLDANLGPHVMGPTRIIIPYAALRPLLRPRTPLNRLLVARGLPPVL